MENLGKVEMELDILKSQKAELEKQIGELYSRQMKIDNRIRERLEFIEREKYHGLLFWEYQLKIQGIEYTEGDYTIRIGLPNQRSISVTTKEGDKEISVFSSYNSQDGELRVYRRGDYLQGTKFYEKKYWSGEIPKNKKELYEKMLVIKNKYAQKVLNAEIKLPQEAK